MNKDVLAIVCVVVQNPKFIETVERKFGGPISIEYMSNHIAKLATELEKYSVFSDKKD